MNRSDVISDQYEIMIMSQGMVVEAFHPTQRIRGIMGLLSPLLIRPKKLCQNLAQGSLMCTNANISTSEQVPETSNVSTLCSMVASSSLALCADDIHARQSGSQKKT